MESYHSFMHENLMILVKIFPNLPMESKLQKGMFKIPNSKGMQSVLYSLMFITNPDYCKEFVPWPTTFASDNYKFQKAVIEFIRKECTDFEEPKLLKSLLTKANGEKFVKFMFNFVTYITKVVLNKKFDTVILEKPPINNITEENLKLLDKLSPSILQEDLVFQNEHESLMNNVSRLVESKTQTLEIKIKELSNIRQKLLTDFEETSSTDEIIQGTEEKISRLNDKHDSLLSDVNIILKKQELLINLINLKKRISENVIDPNYLKTVINEDFAETVKIPLPIINKNLFRPASNEYPECISLSQFLLLGSKVLNAHIKRFTEFNLPQDLTKYDTLVNCSAENNKRINSFTVLEQKLGDIIERCKSKLSELEQGKFNDDISQYLIKLYELQKFNEFYPRMDISIEKKHLLHGFFKEFSDSELMKKLEKKTNT